MTETEIIIDWLSHKENRMKLPIKEMTKHDYEAYASYGDIFSFGESECKVGCFGKSYLRIKIIENK